MDNKTNRVLVINNGSIFTERIVEICQDNNCIVDMINWYDFEHQSQDYDLHIFTGGSYGGQDMIDKEIEMVRNINTPIIGICLGFEMIARAFDSELVEMEGKERMVLPINVIVDDKIFNGIDEINGYEAHHWKVTKVGNELIPLAVSRDGVEVIKHISRPIYGFQFHPEESQDDDCGVKLFQNVFTLLRLGM